LSSISVLRSMVDIALLAIIALAAFSFWYFRVVLIRAFRIHEKDA
jgi:hypothetical protein